jgi:hydrogenase maturation protease
MRNIGGISKVLILGVGNEFMSDDGCGVCISEALIGNVIGADVLNIGAAGLNIIDKITDYDVLIIIDAAMIEEPSRVFDLEKKEDYEMASETVLDLLSSGSHNLGIESIITMTRLIFGHNPRIIIVGCKPKSLEFGKGLTEEGLKNAMKTVEKLAEVLREYNVEINIDEVKSKVNKCGNRFNWS